MVTLTGKHTVDIDHARTLVKDVDAWDAAIDALLQEGTFTEAGHLELIERGDMTVFMQGDRYTV